jgi:hypothetical protein
MKNLTFVIAGMLICSALFIQGCKKDTPSTTTTTTTPSLSNKLAFTIKDVGGNLVAGAAVKTYTSTGDRTTGNALNSGTTDGNGSVTFANFAAGTTYYYSVDANVGSSSKHTDGSVVAAQNQTVSTTVQFN